MLRLPYWNNFRTYCWLLFQKKASLMKQVLAPIAAKFTSLMEKMVAEIDADKQLAYAQSINTAMALAR